MTKLVAIALIASLSACITYAPTDVDININQPDTAQGAEWLLPRKVGEARLRSVSTPGGDKALMLSPGADAEPASGSDWQVIATLLKAMGADGATQSECLGRRVDVVSEASFGGAPWLAGMHAIDPMGHVVYLATRLRHGHEVERDRVLEHELAHVVAACLGLSGHPAELFGDDGALVVAYGSRHALGRHS